jgi:hypothetical protein
MNITSGGTAILGYAIGAVLLRYLSPQEAFVVAAVLAGPGWSWWRRPSGNTRSVKRMDDVEEVVDHRPAGP